ncbi:hypothetical protein, partial [Adlercreutzia equolifaciens]|uniref:hypothetical protein n=1 Tax=Adlercreutzia equolifaciens TaxID=446660 RepID=UPI003AEF6BF0
DAEDFHIARASPSIRAVSRMDVLLPAIIGQRARRRMRYPHSAKEDFSAISPGQPPLEIDRRSSRFLKGRLLEP